MKSKTKGAALKVAREDFLGILEQMQPGLSPREIVQQSSCFVFADGRITTFNEEVACQAASGLPDNFKGAVQAGSLTEILRKLPDEYINLSMTKSKMIVMGRNRKTGITMEREILLPIDSVEAPKKWIRLHEDFTDAITIVQECASRDQSAFTFTCIHIHPDFMEACDNLQLTRYALETGVPKPFLVRRDSLKHVPSFQFTKFSLSENWMHFKSKKGLVMSCRRYSEKFEDLSSLLKSKGTPTVLPKALGEAAQRCEIFSKENSDDNVLNVELRPGLLRIRGEGATGFHMEAKKLKYDGKVMKFRIAPKLLVELLKRHTDCTISKKHRLLVDGGKFKYVVCLEKE